MLSSDLEYVREGYNKIVNQGAKTKVRRAKIISTVLIVIVAFVWIVDLIV